MMKTVLFAALVAGGALVLGCGPKVAVDGPGTTPDQGDGGGAKARRASGPAPLRQVLIGEMCPTAAAGRPAVLPLFARGVTWSDDAEDLSARLERSAVRQFTVLGWRGQRAGVFSHAGVADVGMEALAVIGAYTGGSPCAAPSVKKDDGTEVGAGDDATCAAAQAGCGIAFGALERVGGGFGTAMYGEEPEPLELDIGGACVSGAMLLVDVDADGAIEAYPVASFLDPVRAPAEEVIASTREGGSCVATFAVRQAIPAADPKHWRGMDITAVVDVDGDGRREIIATYHYEDHRTVAIYTATDSVARLDLVGEAVPWPRP
jgi:hypothetical protein